jgi:hypothetical protein
MSRLKIAGLILVMIPLTILLIFTIGETVGGDASGLQHLVQAAPLVLFTLWAWKKPRVGGWVLLIAAIIVAVLYPWSKPDQPLRFTALTELMLFGPAIAAGLLFVVAARKERDLQHLPV